MAHGEGIATNRRKARRDNLTLPSYTLDIHFTTTLRDIQESNTPFYTLVTSYPFVIGVLLLNFPR